MKLLAAIAIASVAGAAQAQVYFSDFEDDGGGFISSLNGDWEWGIPVGADGTALGGFGGPEPVGGFSGDYAWGTVIGGLHNPNTFSELSTTIDARGFTDLSLNFWEWLDSGGNTFDMAEVRINGELISLRDGGPTNDWREVTLDISQFDNQLFNLEFVFETTGVVERVGWYIDNVAVNGVPTPGSVAMLGLGGMLAARRRR